MLALMPVPGELDIVIASELMEAGRAIQRGLVTPDRTTLIASTHRVYSMTERTHSRMARWMRNNSSKREDSRAHFRASRFRTDRARDGKRHQRGAVRRARGHRRAAVLARAV